MQEHSIGYDFKCDLDRKNGREEIIEMVQYLQSYVRHIKTSRIKRKKKKSDNQYWDFQTRTLFRSESALMGSSAAN